MAKKITKTKIKHIRHRKKTKTRKKEETKPDIHSIRECPECASINIVYNDEKQQIICNDCGLIYEPLTPEEEEKFEKVLKE